MPFNQNAAAYANLFKNQMQQDSNNQNQYRSQAYAPATTAPTSSNSDVLSGLLSGYQAYTSSYVPRTTGYKTISTGDGTYQEPIYSTPSMDDYMTTDSFKQTSGGK